MQNVGMIYGLIGQAMREVGAIGKDSVNQQQRYKFRGIDAVYNALNPVMSKLGLFICPEIIDQRREERQNANGTILKYSVLTIRYTMFAPDGSSVSCTVVGEGMDSGDKASNKAMSVALKYAAFQLFMIPTEEMVDPDAETHVITSRAQEPAKPAPVQQETAPVKMARAETVPPVQKAPAQEPAKPAPAKPAPAPVTPVLEYLAKEREALRVVRQIDKAQNNALFKKQISVLTDAGIIPAKPLAEYTRAEAENLIAAMYNRFDPTGTVLKDAGKTA